MRRLGLVSVAIVGFVSGLVQAGGCECPKPAAIDFPPSGTYVITDPPTKELAQALVEIRNDVGARTVRIAYTEAGEQVVVVYDMWED
ncbi:MAG: hypothetical protein H6738_25660 [Alphaproteobacteria bacterium]|nr:hypothetical protein [Alphaproteobacteria bacterium]